MKSTKKSTQIKGEVINYVWDKPQLVLPIDNPDALVDQIATKIANSLDWPEAGHWPGFQKAARAVLKDLGVPLKKARK